MGVFQALVEGFRHPCEPINSLTHLGGSLAAVCLARPLIALGRDRHRTPVLSLYIFGVVLSLGISGLFHSLERGGPPRLLMQRLDHYAIWLLIAVTFTAVHYIGCRGFWRWGILGIVWAYGSVGISLQVLWFDTFKHWPGLVLYLGMGWIGIASIIKLGREMGFPAVRPLIYGGVFFTVGALVEPMGLPVLVPNWAGPHELFHLAVIGGIFMHWRFIQRLLRGERVLPRAEAGDWAEVARRTAA